MSQHPPEPEWVTRHHNPNRRITGRTWALIVMSPILVLAGVGIVMGLLEADDIEASLEAFVAGAIYFAIGVAIYFLPSYVATKRDVRQKSAVVVINILLGWTLIGWVVALAMAFAAVDEPAR